MAARWHRKTARGNRLRLAPGVPSLPGGRPVPAGTSPESVERQAAWQREHPVAMAAIWLAAMSGILPALAMALLP